MTTTDSPPAVDAPARAPAAVVVGAAAGLSLVVLGAVVGGLGLLLVPTRPVVWGVAVPVAWAAAAINYISARLAQGAFAGWWAPLLPLGGWLAVVVTPWIFSPGGDKISVYDDTGLIYFALGVVAASLPLGTSPVSRTRR